MRNHILLMLSLAALGATALPAGAAPYWIAYEGNDFPENEGWERYTTDPPAERWLEDGSLYTDTRADTHTTDSYAIPFDGGLDPEASETFILSWRLKVEDSYRSDTGVVVRSDDHWAVTFLFDEDTLMSLYEPTVYVDIEPYVYHEYEFHSSDMRNYQLYMDGDLAIEGIFFESLSPSSGVAFGDIAHGAASLVAWDYVRFGVVPEPTTWLMIAIALPLFRRRWQQNDVNRY